MILDRLGNFNRSNNNWIQRTKGGKWGKKSKREREGWLVGLDACKSRQIDYLLCPSTLDLSIWISLHTPISFASTAQLLSLCPLPYLLHIVFFFLLTPTQISTPRNYRILLQLPWLLQEPPRNAWPATKLSI